MMSSIQLCCQVSVEFWCTADGITVDTAATSFWLMLASYLVALHRCFTLPTKRSSNIAYGFSLRPHVSYNFWARAAE